MHDDDEDEVPVIEPRPDRGWRSFGDVLAEMKLPIHTARQTIPDGWDVVRTQWLLGQGIIRRHYRNGLSEDFPDTELRSLKWS